jgi:hypothetical protein
MLHLPLLLDGFVRVQRPNRGVSCDLKLFDFPDAGNVFRREHFVEVAQVLLEVFQDVALRPGSGMIASSDHSRKRGTQGFLVKLIDLSDILFRFDR